MSVQLPKSRQSTLESLDEEIRLLSEQLLRLKAQRNTFSITYSLPPEILGEIFTIVQAECKDIPKDYFANRPFKPFQLWLQPTHVSQYWRTLALGLPKLWCEIDSTVPWSAISAFLVRSGEASISVMLDSTAVTEYTTYPPLADAFLSEIFAHRSRIQEFSITGEEAFCDVLPHLRAPSSWGIKKLAISGSMIFIPDDIFGRAPPCLTSLHLQLEQMSLKSPLFMSTLSTLIVEFSDITSTTEWLQILQQMPQLLNLTWHPVVSKSRYAPIPMDFGVIVLHHLVYLDLNGNFWEHILDFLSHIVFPSQTKFKFESTTPDQSTTPPLIEFLRIHNQSRQSPSEMQIAGIALTDSSDNIEGPYGEVGFIALAGDSELPYLDFRIWGPTIFALDEPHVTALSSLPLSSITSFTIGCSVEKDAWQLLSHQCPTVHTITCTSKAIPALMPALLIVRGAHPEEVDSGLFKSLKTLHFHDHPALHTSYIILLALTTRRDNGLPIKEIRFSEFEADDASDHLISQLRTLVDVIHLDAKEEEETKWYQFLSDESEDDTDEESKDDEDEESEEDDDDYDDDDDDDD